MDLVLLTDETNNIENQTPQAVNVVVLVLSRIVSPQDL
jgi:hypothetical protein